METFKFDPKIFISPPFIKCPKCNEEAFGVLTINKNSYTRRCRECFFPKGGDRPQIYDLPKLNKEVIYLDQLVISEMMKSLNPKTKAYQKGQLDTFWLTLFEKLDTLSKLQLIICPDSNYHTNESLLSPYFEQLERLYKLLSHGVSFYDRGTIERFQVYENMKNWIAGRPDDPISIDVEDVVHGDINAWRDKLLISIKREWEEGGIEKLRQDRDQINSGFLETFTRWQSETDKDFDYWFHEEWSAYGRLVLQVYFNYLKTYVEVAIGKTEPTTNFIFPPDPVVLIHECHRVLRDAGLPDTVLWDKTVEYFSSPSLRHVPTIKISSMLYASLARKAAAGQKSPPTKGMTNDIGMISSLLPYCDAIFIDNECHTYLTEQPLCDEVNYGTKIFSPNNRDEFMEYLNSIEAAMPTEHLEKVSEVYGSTWCKPYTTLFTDE
ncbi:MAG: hypothetical protein CEE38_18810 [Planctomycetes bacterium B3_Pla]|nr:MAG: hypothetical protein CEE38_18810 [Planctomycetes bacterium B3_Pla]